MDLLALLAQPEGKTIEFKRDLSSPAGFLRAVTAFANTAGGTIIIGVEDRTRHVVGVGDPLALEERAANLISDSISPRLVPEIELLCYRDTHVLAVRVHPSASRPHHLGPLPESGTYVRVGSTNRRADGILIEEMQRFVRGESFDERPWPDVDSEALDFRAASESFAEFRTLEKNDLEILGLCTMHHGRKVATVGGVLLYGQDRLDHFPDAWIQAGRFDGLDRSRIADHVQLTMPLAEAIPAAIAFVERHTERGLEIGAVRHRTRRAVPPLAVREAIINSVVHADYSQRGAPIRVAVFDDRLEVENPGLLPFGLTIEDLPRGVSKLRNRVIGRVFHELGLIEHWGSGVQRMIASCQQAGVPVPNWEEIGTRLRVTMSTEPVDAATADPIDQAILDLLDSGDRTTSEIAGAIGRSTRATRTRLSRLVDQGRLVAIGRGPRDPRRVYRKA